MAGFHAPMAINLTVLVMVCSYIDNTTISLKIK